MHRTEYARAWRQKNKLRLNAERREKSNTPEGREQRLRHKLQYEYGLTLDQYRELVNKYGARCPVCTKQPPDRLVVDHDHKTGQVRGLLCSECNLALGKLKDDPMAIRRLMTYVVEAQNMARKPIRARLGGYMTDVDSSGDRAMDITLQGKPTGMSSTEKAYFNQAKNQDSASEAIRRTRRSNRTNKPK